MNQLEDLRELAEEYAAIERNHRARVLARDVHTADFRQIQDERDLRARILAMTVAKALNIEIGS